MAEQKKQRGVLVAVIVFVIILCGVAIWRIAIFEPAPQLQAEYPRHEPPPSEPFTASTDKSPRTDTALKPGLKKVIDAAGNWGPTFESWFGKSAPDFTLTDINGKQHKLSDYRGKNVMLIFWATWCGPCRMEIPELIQLRNTVSKDKLAMLAISYISPRNTTEMVKNFVAQNKEINYTVLSVNSSDLPAPYNLVNPIPCSFFIDPQGVIKLATVGLLQLSDMKAVLQAE